MLARFKVIPLELFNVFKSVRARVLQIKVLASDQEVCNAIFVFDISKMLIQTPTKLLRIYFYHSKVFLQGIWASKIPNLMHVSLVGGEEIN